MSKTIDIETPIFGKLYEEIGELPEIVIHDFDEHAFDFLRDAEEPAEADEQPQPGAGGRRRKED